MPTASNGKVLLRVRPRGFCAGVVRAVDIVELALEAYGAPVYVHHEIVHNTYVVEQLRRRGAIFVESIGEVPHGAVLVFSAHGVPPTVREVAKDIDLILVVGSQNSSNSNRLVEVAQRRGVNAKLIDAASDVDPAWLDGVKSVGLTAGASAPEILVEQVSQRLADLGFTDQRDLDLIREDVRFTLPPELATIAPASRR